MPAVGQSKIPKEARTLWSTPPGLFKKLNGVFRFEVDVCAQIETAKCARFFCRPGDLELLKRQHPNWTDYDGWTYLPGPDRFVKEDALSQPWGPVPCFMNPPFGRTMPPFLEKAWQEAQRGSTVVAIIPDDTSTRWYHDLVRGRADVWPLDGRVEFVLPPEFRDLATSCGNNNGNHVAIYWPAGFWSGKK